jgi:hypothetical protein
MPDQPKGYGIKGVQGTVGERVNAFHPSEKSLAEYSMNTEDVYPSSVKLTL